MGNTRAVECYTSSVITSSDSIELLAAAIVAAQAEMPVAAKDQKGNYGAYADLPSVISTVRPVLVLHGLGFVQSPFGDGERIGVTTRLIHRSGQWMEGSVSLVAGKQTPQGAGGAITYARRYGLQSMLGLITDDDDDGQKSSEVAERPKDKGGPWPTTAYTEVKDSTISPESAKKATEYATSKGLDATGLKKAVNLATGGRAEFVESTYDSEKAALLAAINKAAAELEEAF